MIKLIGKNKKGEISKRDITFITISVLELLFVAFLLIGRFRRKKSLNDNIDITVL